MMTTATETAFAAALSRHRGARDRRFAVNGQHLNAWCTVSGNPFVGGCTLLPNRPGEPAPEISFGPITHDRLGAITLLFNSAADPAHANVLAVTARAATADGAVLAEREIRMEAGARLPLTLHLPETTEPVWLTIAVTLAEFDGTQNFGSVRLRYVVAYADSELMRLFNAAGSDKGSEVYWGEGVPHLYALVYEPLLAPRREQPLQLLEIGLDTASEHTGSPEDAPSLRAWREYLPEATLHGFDIHDFGFLDQPGTRTFQGDQSAPADLARFRETLGAAELDVIIDDGSHVPSHQQVALAHLFSSLAPGGVYVIEDLFWQPGHESPTTAEVLRRFANTGTIESPFIAEADARRLEHAIAGVRFARPNDSELAILARRPA